MLDSVGIPNLLLSRISQASMAQSQKRLSDAQTEVSTGRHHDMGLALGATTGVDIKIRLELAEVTQAHDLMQQAGTKATATQAALQSVSQLSTDFLSTLSGARSAAQGRQLSSTAASTSLVSLTDLLNTSFGGQYLFGGLNTADPPMQKSGGGAQLQTITDAFSAQFGFPPTDAAAANLSADQISSFLDGGFADQFSAANWSANWSQATDANPVERVGASGAVDVSSNANAGFVRKLTQSFSMIAVFSNSKLSDSAFQTVIDRSMKLVAEGQRETGSEQARIGIGQQRLTSSATSLDQQKSSLTAAISSLESVDPYEAATRVNTLTTQLETSYAVTGRISKLSLLSYI